ncbi:MAG: NAD(P)H-dependent oxidoreductase [Pyrinomonadaceae bacterium]|nr:NAD(P)H-dependent oxidoreductase [Sphingobacteriaceae bacterium]
MKAIILLSTLKKEGLSNTQTLSEFLVEQLEKRKVECEIIKLLDYNILAGTYSDMGEGDEWPEILKKIKAAQILLFSTPVWWGSHSSEMQKVIERLDHIHDEILEGKKSQLDGKVAGIIITGDSDGAEQIIGIISNFLNAIGLIFPPYTTLSVLWEGQAKGVKTSRDGLMKKYRKEYSKTAETMAEQLVKFASKKN